jgi:CheY-like chemotaxis protein/HPt (histidine-containing phosphotransfer) domain-containing protein
MGGDITAASVYGQGSIFTATLNQAVEDWTPMGDLSAASATRIEAQRISFIAPEAEVLVADDLSSNLLVAEGLLAPYKVRVFTCLNGREAMALVQARYFDLVLMDHMMPEMDGLEAARAIRALGGRFAELPIAALTANAVSGMNENFLAGGFNDFLSKPIETDDLDALLQRWIPAAKQQTVSADGKTIPEDALSPETPWPRIEGLDTAAGMARVGGSPDRYRELLQIFLRDAQARLTWLEAIPDQASLQPFTTCVHALKSGLANIGADALSGRAARLEQAGRNGDMAVIRDHLASFRDNLAALTARIGEATAEAQPGVPEAGRENESAALPREALAELKAALEARDTDGMDAILAKLQNLPLGPETRAAVTGLAQHILFGDFKKTAEAVNSLLAEQ